MIPLLWWVPILDASAARTKLALNKITINNSATINKK
jgi:hypothetical protein